MPEVGPAPPRSGDLVRARTDDRSATEVVGVLQLRHVPHLGYVQVVVHADARAWPVAPDTVEVIDRDVEAADALEAADPLTGQPGWRRISDLSEAADLGLLLPAREVGRSWAELSAELHARCSTLFDAGWQLQSEDREESVEYGDSIILTLRRGDETVELEYGDDNLLVAWQGGDVGDEDTAPVFTMVGSTEASAAEAFRAQGWC